MLAAGPVFGDGSLSSAARAADVLNSPENQINELELLPPPVLSPPEGAHDAGGDFPPLPPAPQQHEAESLPSLEDELWNHGGAYLYSIEGDRLGWPADDHGHSMVLRLPESWEEPKPITAFSEFLGADPVQPGNPNWLLPSEYFSDPRFTAYGSYTLFGFAHEQGSRQQDVLGHQLIVDLDGRLTGTERFHMQFRPLGRRDTGGSYLQFSDPKRYIDNSTGIPDRFWFEGELHSLLGQVRDPFAKHYVNLVVGKFPFRLHNALLMNDDILGAVVSKNNLYLGGISNINVQLWAGLDDVDTFTGVKSEAYGCHLTADHRRAFYEVTYGFVRSPFDRNTHFAGISRTETFGRLTLAARVLMKAGDRGGTGNAQVLTMESNYTGAFEHGFCGLEHWVGFCNAFWASEGWTSIGGGNFNRLRTAFVVDPLLRLAGGPAADDVSGVSIGVQLFRHHDDESLIPEIAWEAPGGRSVAGAGLRYLRKTGARSFLEVLGVINRSNDSRFDREGVFASHSWIF